MLITAKEIKLFSNFFCDLKPQDCHYYVDKIRHRLIKVHSFARKHLVRV